MTVTCISKLSKQQCGFVIVLCVERGISQCSPDILRAFHICHIIMIKGIKSKKRKPYTNSLVVWMCGKSSYPKELSQLCNLTTCCVQECNL